jgi:hypothetical protein
MWKRLVTGLGAAASLALAAGCASPAVSAGASSPAPVRHSGDSWPATASSAVPTPASSRELPQLELRPASEPVGLASTAPVEVHVASCPVPASGSAGIPYSTRPAPATLTLPASLALPGNAQIFGITLIYGTTVLPGDTSYLLGPKSAACQRSPASADGSEIMTVTSFSHPPGSVTMVIRPGGVGPATDLACPYIPAVRAADEVFRQGHVICSHPSAEVIRQIPTGTAGLYAAAVFVPARVADPRIQGSGDGSDQTVALYTAAVGGGAAGQMIACALAPAQADICAASLEFFLATQAQISTRISAANLSRMEDALTSFVAEENM